MKYTEVFVFVGLCGLWRAYVCVIKFIEKNKSEVEIINEAKIDSEPYCNT